MKWLLLLVFVFASCLSRGKKKDDDSQTKPKTSDLTDKNKKDDDSQTKNDKRDNSSQNFFYHKYNFSKGGDNIEIVIKIERNSNGEFTDLHTIELSKKTQINSMPLASVPQAIHHGYKGGRSYFFTGDSYIGLRGRYFISYDYDGNLADVSINDLTNTPPQIKFTNFARQNSQDVIWQGRALQKLTAHDWQRLAAQRSNAQPVIAPPPLPNHLSHWFDNNFNGQSYLQKLERNRTITVGGNTHSGAVYELFDSTNRCFAQVWGLDNVEVMRFLYSLRDKIRLEKKYSGDSGTLGTVIICDSSSDGNIHLECEPNLLKDQGVFRVVGNNLVIDSLSGGNTVYMNSQGQCYDGPP